MSKYDKNGKLRDSYVRNKSNMLNKFNMNKIAQYDTFSQPSHLRFDPVNRNSVVLSARHQVESDDLGSFENQPGSVSYRGLNRPSQDQSNAMMGLEF